MMQTTSESRLRQALLVIIVFVLVTGAWETWVRYHDISDLILPPPSKIGERLVGLLHTGAFWQNFMVTITEVVAGYGLGIVLAVVLGAVISQFVVVEEGLMPYIIAFQTIPSIALAPLFRIWFGYGMTSKVVMAALIALFPILVNVIAGLQASSKTEIQLLRAFGASPLQVLFKVRVPNALPYLFVGLNLGAIFALIGAIVGEFAGASSGLGKMIQQFDETLKVADMFAVLIVLALIGMVMHCGVGIVRRKVVFWTAE